VTLPAVTGTQCSLNAAASIFGVAPARHRDRVAADVHQSTAADVAQRKLLRLMPMSERRGIPIMFLSLLSCPRWAVRTFSNCRVSRNLQRP
jgi:hypothetical protein